MTIKSLDYKKIIEETDSRFKGIKVKEDNDWYYFNITNNLLSQGWKGHLSSQVIYATKTIKLAIPIFFNNACSFKIVKDKNSLKKLNDFHYPLFSANKFITFYPKDEYHLSIIIKELMVAVGNFPAPRIFTDYQIKPNSPIHFRYGGFKKISHYSKEDNRLIFYIKNKDNMLVEDVRRAGVYKPDWIKLPHVLNELLINDTSKNDSYLFSKYSITGSFSRANKGGVFLGYDKETKKQVVIKEARSNITFEEYPFSCIELLKNEYKILNFLVDSNITPQVFDFIEEQDNYYMVSEYLQGENLTKNFKNNPEPSINTKMKYADEIINIVTYLHNQNIAIGDISTNNFLITNKGIKLIDLETAHLFSNKSISDIGTKGFINIETQTNTKEKDEFTLIFTLISLLIWKVPYFEMNRNKELSWKSKFQVIYKYALEIKNIDFLKINFIKDYFSKYKVLQDSDDINLKNDKLFHELIALTDSYYRQNLSYDKLKDWNFSDFSRETNPFCIQHGYLSGLTFLSTSSIKLKDNYLSSIKNIIFKESVKYFV